jgi:hypothetical protein
MVCSSQPRRPVVDWGRSKSDDEAARRRGGDDGGLRTVQLKQGNNCIKIQSIR